MKKTLLIIGALLVVGGLVYWGANNLGSKGEWTTYNDEELGISFDYRTEPNPHVIEESAMSVGASDNHIKTLVVMLQSDYQSLLSGERDGGEGPASITIQAFGNPNNLSPRVWIERNPQWSHFPLIMGEISETTVDGKGAITYEADGLYGNRNVVVAEGDRIYMLNGAYLRKDDTIYSDFDRVLNSLEFND